MNHSQFHVLVIGAGLCGLSAAVSIALEGHRVTVFESAPRLHQVGAGIQITPSGSRLLRKWGVAEELEKKVAVTTSLSIFRYDGQKVLAHRPQYDDELKSRYGDPLWCLHRVDLQQALARRAEELGVRLVFDSRVSHVDFENTSVTSDKGLVENGDLVVAADGLWSTTRGLLLGRSLPPQPTGDLAYRIALTADQIQDDELRHAITLPQLRIWMGPESHAVAYSVRGGQTLNIVLFVPDDLPLDVAKSEGNLNEMAKLFEGWDPLLNKYLSLVKEVAKWKLMYIELDESWISQQGTFVMAGDSCHPMLPYLAQGANIAFEDGATLGALLGTIKSKTQIPMMMRLYESLRKERAAKIREQSFIHQREFHLPDGEEQMHRDQLLARSFENERGEDRWTHPKIQPWLFEFDTYEVVREAAFATLRGGLP